MNSRLVELLKELNELIGSRDIVIDNGEEFLDVAYVYIDEESGVLAVRQDNL